MAKKVYGHGRRIFFDFEEKSWEASHDVATTSVFYFQRADEYEGLKQCFSAVLPLKALRSKAALLEACRAELENND